MNILDEIVANKRDEVILHKKRQPIQEFNQMKNYHRTCLSITNSITKQSASGIIAEFKRQSPSKGIINNQVLVEPVVKGYETAGVSGISVLTDEKFFGGSLLDLLCARQAVNIPILRKEFIVNPYQIHQAKAYGADFILLIAAYLSPEEAYDYTAIAHELGLEVLIEIHNEDELRVIPENIDVVGVNNRNLKSFEVSIETSIDLFSKMPSSVVKISESGISSTENILKLKNVGFQGFLIGENFMKTEDPGLSCKHFIKNLSA